MLQSSQFSVNPLNIKFLFIITFYFLLTIVTIIISLLPLTLYAFFVLQQKNIFYFITFPLFGILLWLVSFLIFVTLHGRVIVKISLPKIKEGSYPLKSSQNLIYSIRLSADNIAKYWCKTFEIIPFITQLYLNKFFLKAYGVKIGKNAYISTEVRIDGIPLIEFGDNIFIGPRAIIGAHINHGGDQLGGNILYRGVKIGNNCFIGNNAAIIPGVKMGDNSVLGAMSVVLLDTEIPSNETWVGMPAKMIKKNGSN